jgi:hypothetical protein
VSIEYLTRTSQGMELNGIDLGAAEGEFTYGFH